MQTSPVPVVLSATTLITTVTFWLLLQQPNPCLAQTFPGLRSPILFIPGLFRSQLQVKDVNPHCNTHGRFVGLWMDPIRIVTDLLTECAQKEFELVYNATTNVYSNRDGVTIKVPGFGDTQTIEYIDTDDYIPSYHDFVQYFVDRGYVRGKNIRAAPYDWRLAADGLEQRGYYDKLMNLVEQMYKDNGQQKVTIVVHSMGGPVSLHFLTGYRNVTQEWKDKYINAWIPLSGGWSGSNSVLQYLISGLTSLPSLFTFKIPNIIMYFLDRFLILPIIRTFESGVWMLPRATVWGDTTLVSTPSRNYTANDYQQLFSDVGFNMGYEMFEHVLPINRDYPAPNVTTYCLYGVGVNTTKSISFAKDFDGTSPADESSNVIFGDGDGIVNIQSSEICLKWRNMPSAYPFTSRTYEGVGHHNMTKNAHVLAYVAEIVGVPTTNPVCDAVTASCTPLSPSVFSSESESF